MKPIQFDLEQTILLPPHELIVYAKDQPDYIPLPVARLEGAEGRVISRWTLTAEERAAIAAGEDLYIQVLTFPQQHTCPCCAMPCHMSGALQPIFPAVGLLELCPADLKG